MLNVLTRFSVIFVPTCAIGVAGLWLGLNRSGFPCIVGWIIAVVLGAAAGLQLFLLVSGLRQIDRLQHGAMQTLQQIEQRDADLFAKGKSFEEVISQYEKTP